MPVHRRSDSAYDLILNGPRSDQFAWWEWNVRDNSVTASPGKVEMIGYDFEDFADAGFEAYTDLLHPDDYERTMEAMRAHLEGRAELYEIDYRIQTRSGDYLWYMDRGAIIERGPNDEPLVVRGIVLNLGPRLHEAVHDDSVVAAVRESLSLEDPEKPPIICAQCGRLGYGFDRWVEVGDDVSEGLQGTVSHTLCPDCIHLLYPQAAQRILARLQTLRRTIVHVALLEPTRLVRELLSRALRDEELIAVNGVFSDEPGFMDHLRAEPIDVAIISAELADGRCIEMIKRVVAEIPRIKVLSYCLCRRNVFAVRAVKAGARGFLDANASVDELPHAIRAIATNEFYVSNTTAEHVVEESVRRDGEPHTRLSDREFQIMLLFAERKSVSEIARTLNVSRSTVTTHQHNILEKMELQSTSDLTRYAVEHDLMDWEALL